MSQAKRSNGAAESADAEQAEGNVDKIRDILFGGQMREYERRFERLEADFRFDPGKRLVEKTVTGGEFVTREDYIAQQETQPGA